MEIVVQHLGNVKFEAATRGHRILCDQPPENRGSDSGMTPPELLLASLGTCAGFYAAEYLRTRNLQIAGLEVRVTAEKASAPARLAKFRIEVKAPGLAPEHEAGVLRAVHACLIHNTLTHPPAVEIVLESRQLAPVA